MAGDGEENYVYPEAEASRANASVSSQFAAIRTFTRLILLSTALNQQWK